MRLSSNKTSVLKMSFSKDGRNSSNLGDGIIKESTHGEEASDVLGTECDYVDTYDNDRLDRMDAGHAL